MKREEVFNRVDLYFLSRKRPLNRNFPITAVQNLYCMQTYLF